ncbi:MAG TPA: hypothetical protein VFA32_21455, partial [Dehalococcoidia bacterium]|nr:hypothetical protein [Dehalococcoidia bacterium]
MLQCRRCHSRKLVALSKKSPQDNDVFRCQECSFLFSPASVASGPPKNTAPPEPAKSPAPHTTGETPREPGTLVQPRKPSGVSKIIAPPALSPLDFAADVLGVELWSKQKEVLAALPQHRRVAVKSGNGLGKGFCAGVAVC